MTDSELKRVEQAMRDYDDMNVEYDDGIGTVSGIVTVIKWTAWFLLIVFVGFIVVRALMVSAP